jgi:hypothetical protein
VGVGGRTREQGGCKKGAIGLQQFPWTSGQVPGGFERRVGATDGGEGRFAIPPSLPLRWLCAAAGRGGAGRRSWMDTSEVLWRSGTGTAWDCGVGCGREDQGRHVTLDSNTVPRGRSFLRRSEGPRGGVRPEDRACHFRRGRCLGSHGRSGPKAGAIDASTLLYRRRFVSLRDPRLEASDLSKAAFITEVQNLLSNSKVRKVIHSGRITFRVFTNYIPRFGGLHSAVMANYIPHFPVGPQPRPAVSA